MSAPSHALPLACPACGVEVDAADVSEAALMARCRGCQKVFDLTARLRQAVALQAGSGGGVVPVATEIKRRRAERPATVSVVETPGALTVHLPPASRRHTARVLGVTLAVLTSIALSTMVSVFFQQLTAEQVAFLVAEGGVLAWVGAVALFNQVSIVVDRSGLAIRRGPIPGAMRQHVRREDIHQLFVEERPVQGRGAPPECVLSALVGPDRRREVLVHEFTDVQSAVWLEQTLERALGLKDVPVGGELPR